MSYKIEQKIGKHIYIYEVTSYWDKERKQSRQKRIYLGKKDLKSGNLIEVKSKFIPTKVKDFGSSFFIDEICKTVGLTEIIKNIFPTYCNQILNLIQFQVAEGKPFYLYPNWESSTSVTIKTNQTSQSISVLLFALGKMDYEKDSFFKKWSRHIKKNEAVFYDITSFSSYSKLIDLVEWGYNRDKEKIPQINFGLMFTAETALPLYYDIYQGSISDSQTISNIVDQAKEMAIKKCTFVLDRGFYSESNIKKIYEHFDNFIIPMPFTSKISKSLLDTTKNISEAKNIFTFDNKALFCIQGEVEIASKKLFSHIFLDEIRRGNEINNFAKKISIIEAKILGKSFRSEEKAKSFLKLEAGDYQSLFKAEKFNNVFKLTSDDKRRADLMNRMGKMILLTKKQLDKIQVLSVYRGRDSVEKTFDNLKNEMNESRLRVSSRESVQGKILLNFFSLIIYSYISKRMKDKNLYSQLTFSELMLELKKIKKVEMSSKKTYLTEISKTQKDIFKAFEIKIPKT